MQRQSSTTPAYLLRAWQALRQISPLNAALLNCLVGVLLPIPALIWMDPGSAGALVGFAACIALFWAAPAGSRRWPLSFLALPVGFAMGSSTMFGGSALGLNFLGEHFGLAILLALSAGGLMGLSLGYVAQSFDNPTAGFRLQRAVVSGLAGLCGVLVMPLGIAVALSGGLVGAIVLLPIFPGLWLGTTTYVCLKLVRALSEPSPENGAICQTGRSHA